MGKKREANDAHAAHVKKHKKQKREDPTNSQNRPPKSNLDVVGMFATGKANVNMAAANIRASPGLARY
jgi:hypothetical protein